MPPVATLPARLVPKGGELVAGHFLPGGVGHYFSTFAL